MAVTDSPREPTFVGRHDEVRRIVAAVTGPGAEDRPGVIVVVGEPGIGKSALLRHAVHRLREVATVRPVRIAGDPAETSLDFGLVDHMARTGGVSAQDRAEAASLSGGGPLEVGAWLVRIVDDVTAPGRLLIVLDDAQDADRPSLDAIAFAARRLRGDRAALIVATRPEGIASLPPGILRLAEDSGEMIHLSGLSPEEGAELVASVRGADTPARVVRRLVDRTGGHPLHLRILADEADDDALAAGAALPTVPSIGTLVVERMATVPDDARRFLDALAVLDSRVDGRTVAALAGLTDPAPAIEALSAAGLVDVHVSDGGSVTVTIRHRLMRDAIYGDLSVSDRLAMHGRAADLLDGDAALRHRVFAATGPDPALAAELIAAAERDHRRGSLHLAAEHLFRAASVSDPDVARDLILRGADHLVAVGRPFDARLDEIETFPDSALRSSVLGRARIASGAFGEAKVHLEDAWARLAHEDHRSEDAATIAETLAIIALSSLDADAVVRWGQRVGDAGGLGATMICHGLTLRGDFDEARRLLVESVPEPDATPAATADTHLARGIVELWSNNLEEARRQLASVLGASMERSLLQTITARSHLADTHLRAGRLVEAADMASEAIALLEDCEAVWLTPLPHSIAAYAQAALGDLDAARGHAAIGSAFADATGDAPATIWAGAAWLRIAEAARDWAEVVTIGDRMVEHDLHLVAEGINHWRVAYAEALAAEGRVADAGRVLDDLDGYVARTGDVSVAAEVARARGTVARLAGDPVAAMNAFEAGLALDAHLSRPLPRARLELATGSLLRRDGQRSAAASLLSDALRRLRSMGAEIWIELCERELAACGQRPAKRSGAAAAVDLTPQERIIARLVAEGRTNRQVAEELFVSVKTVEHHLSRIYAKLGVRTRTQMAAALS